MNVEELEMGDFTTGGDIGGGTDIEAGTEEGSDADSVWTSASAESESEVGEGEGDEEFPEDGEWGVGREGWRADATMRERAGRWGAREGEMERREGSGSAGGSGRRDDREDADRDYRMMSP